MPYVNRYFTNNRKQVIGEHEVHIRKIIQGGQWAVFTYITNDEDDQPYKEEWHALKSDAQKGFRSEINRLKSIAKISKS